MCGRRPASTALPSAPRKRRPRAGSFTSYARPMSISMRHQPPERKRGVHDRRAVGAVGAVEERREDEVAAGDNVVQVVQLAVGTSVLVEAAKVNPQRHLEVGWHERRAAGTELTAKLDDGLVLGALWVIRPPVRDKDEDRLIGVKRATRHREIRVGLACQRVSKAAIAAASGERAVLFEAGERHKGGASPGLSPRRRDFPVHDHTAPGLVVSLKDLLRLRGRERSRASCGLPCHDAHEGIAREQTRRAWVKDAESVDQLLSCAPLLDLWPMDPRLLDPRLLDPQLLDPVWRDGKGKGRWGLDELLWRARQLDLRLLDYRLLDSVWRDGGGKG
eukprot:scaffold67931_cov32-Tisochrysis_lutea.AAC.3